MLEGRERRDERAGDRAGRHRSGAELGSGVEVAGEGRGRTAVGAGLDDAEVVAREAVVRRAG